MADPGLGRLSAARKASSSTGVGSISTAAGKKRASGSVPCGPEFIHDAMTTFARRAAYVAARGPTTNNAARYLAPTFTKLSLSTQAKEVEGGLNPEQLRVLNEMFDKFDKLEENVAKLHEQVKKLDPNFAVDGPDGDSIGHEKEELQEIEHIIEEAALHEDKDAIIRKHKLQDDVKAYHAKDPEHDW